MDPMAIEEWFCWHVRYPRRRPLTGWAIPKSLLRWMLSVVVGSQKQALRTDNYSSSLHHHSPPV